MTNKSSSKVAKNYLCNFCHYNTSKKTNYDKHILTLKHINTKNTNKSSEKEPNEYNCECGKTYKHQSSLWNHKQKCKKEKENSDHIIPNSPSIIMELLKQNGEFKDLLKDQNKILSENNKNIQELISNKQIGNTIMNTNSHNNIRNKFNINFFLNEQCKDAMNIMDFVNSLQLQLSDLETVGEHGYVRGISKILVKNLKELDVCKRPIHCSDLKRETMYVKDEDIWSKEGGKKEKLTKMIQCVAHKNVKQLSGWQKENPYHGDAESIESEKYLKIVGESMGGLTEEDDIENYNRIITTIAKEVIIEKE